MNSLTKKLLVLITFGSIFSGSQVCASFTDDSIKPHKNSLPSLSTVVLAGSLGLAGYYALTRESRLSNYLKEKRERVKHYLVDTVVGPLYLTYDRIRTTGVTRGDVVKGLVIGGALYGTKKLGDHFKLWENIPKGDLTTSQEVLNEDVAFLSRHKAVVGMAVGVACALGWVIKSGLALSLIERFKRSLTFEQRAIISSDENLRELIEKADEDPHALAEHYGLVQHLHEHQKHILQRAVEIHRREQNPLGLLDDLVFEGEMNLT